MKLIAVCQNPNGEGDWWDVTHLDLAVARLSCINGCGCTPKVFADIDGPHVLEVRYDDAEDGHTRPPGWSLEHPIRCRVGGARLLDCELHRYITAAPQLARSLGVGRHSVDGRRDANGNIVGLRNRKLDG